VELKILYFVHTSNEQRRWSDEYMVGGWKNGEAASYFGDKVINVHVQALGRRFLPQWSEAADL